MSQFKKSKIYETFKTQCDQTSCISISKRLYIRILLIYAKMRHIKVSQECSNKVQQDLKNFQKVNIHAAFFSLNLI